MRKKNLIKINKNRKAIHKSFATKATSERLKLLNFEKENKISVEIINLFKNITAMETKVILTIPFTENDKTFFT